MADVDSDIDALFGQGRCSVDGCDKPIHVVKYGWCSLHYQRWRTHGDPLVCKHKSSGIHVCDVCRIEFRKTKGAAGRFCSPACTQAWNKAEQGKSRESVCLTCNKQFLAKRPNRARYCTRSCATQFHYLNGKSLSDHKKHVRFKGKNARDRAIHYGVTYEPIRVIDVFNDAKWLCSLCGIRTLKSKRGTSDQRAPELDHIIPISMGGPHVRDNVQLACRACNGSKGATVRGQLSLFSCVAA
jgi:hypothetical protein